MACFHVSYYVAVLEHFIWFVVLIEGTHAQAKLLLSACVENLVRQCRLPSVIDIAAMSNITRSVTMHVYIFLLQPTTNKLHSIIEKTASFINKQGTQMEIIIKTRQKFNPFFSFLNHDDVLYPYFKHMKEIISTGSYVVQEKKGLEQRKGDSVDDRRESASNHKETRQQKNLTEIDTKIVSSKASVAEVEPKINTVPPGSNSDNKAESDSDDDEYLHPLLLSSSLPGKTQTTSIETPITTSSSSLSSSTSSNVLSSNKCASRTDASSNGKKLTMNEILNLHSTSASFVARSRAVNSAPSTEGEVTQAYETASDADPEAVAAYEFYRQQYYDR